MTVTAFVALIAAVVIVGAALLVVAARCMPSKPPVGRRVTVNTKRPDDQTIHGVMLAQHTDVVVLVDATYVTSGGETPIPGRVRVPLANVAWLQEHE